jgi:two-component system, sensor histidine kinase and response regulator
MEILQQQVHYFPDNKRPNRLKRPDFFLKQIFTHFLDRVKSIGFSETMEEYERRKLGIFNQLNFFQLLTGVLIPVVGLFNQKQLPANAWIIASLPALVSILVLFLNRLYKHEAALLTYFILYPVVTCIVYLYGMNLGVNLFFILYGILSVFFLKDIGYMIFSLCLSMGSYFILSVILKNYEYQLESFNKELFLFNQGLAIVFIFYGLYLIKKEGSVYQFHILEKNSVLQEKNVQIQEQADKIKENATLLRKQTTELTELNALKNKLFSVISHDLKAPLYALRNLFRNVQQDDIPEEELKKIMPDVVNDLNYTVGLMDNLLLWAKTQMQVDAVHPQKVDIGKLIMEVFQLLRLQSDAKHIRMENTTGEAVYGYMDKDMMSLVIRNLLSNAIKFTPEKGNISVGVHEHGSFVEVFVQDSGTGIGNDALLKINKNDFYTTRGTASEAGTGLGLMLCKEYLARNGGQLRIESEMGKGSVFSFSLPKPA